jgi:hypothetical protein
MAPFLTAVPWSTQIICETYMTTTSTGRVGCEGEVTRLRRVRSAETLIEKRLHDVHRVLGEEEDIQLGAAPS